MPFHIPLYKPAQFTACLLARRETSDVNVSKGSGRISLREQVGGSVFSRSECPILPALFSAEEESSKPSPIIPNNPRATLVTSHAF